MINLVLLHVDIHLLKHCRNSFPFSIKLFWHPCRKLIEHKYRAYFWALTCWIDRNLYPNANTTFRYCSWKQQLFRTWKNKLSNFVLLQDYFGHPQSPEFPYDLKGQHFGQGFGCHCRATWVNLNILNKVKSPNPWAQIHLHQKRWYHPPQGQEAGSFSGRM